MTEWLGPDNIGRNPWNEYYVIINIVTGIINIELGNKNVWQSDVSTKVNMKLSITSYLIIDSRCLVRTDVMPCHVVLAPVW